MSLGSQAKMGILEKEVSQGPKEKKGCLETARKGPQDPEAEQAHQEKLCWGSQVQRVILGTLVLKVFQVSEGSLGSLDIQGVVISLDVMGQIEEISSPDAMAAVEAAEDVALPGNLWVKAPHTPREAVT